MPSWNSFTPCGMGTCTSIFGYEVLPAPLDERKSYDLHMWRPILGPSPVVHQSLQGVETNLHPLRQLSFHVRVLLPQRLKPLHHRHIRGCWMKHYQQISKIKGAFIKANYGPNLRLLRLSRGNQAQVTHPVNMTPWQEGARKARWGIHQLETGGCFRPKAQCNLQTHLRRKPVPSLRASSDPRNSSDSAAVSTELLEGWIHIFSSAKYIWMHVIVPRKQKRFWLLLEISKTKQI